MDSGILVRVIKNLFDASVTLLIPSIRIVGNVSTGTSEQTSTLLAQDILTPLENLLNNSKKVVRREVTWVLSNISAGIREHVQFMSFMIGGSYIIET